MIIPENSILIIEGTDNTGKGTLISSFLENLPICKVVHCCKPKSEDPIKAALEQRDLFYKYIKDNISNPANTNILRCPIIYDRSWYGEYVYGCLYRGNGSDFVKDMIAYIESELIENESNQYYPSKAFYIQLVSRNDTLIANNDDGKSISNGKENLINKEKKRFLEIFEYSKLKKKLVYVDDADGKFRNKKDIFNEVVSFINNS